MVVTIQGQVKQQEQNQMMQHLEQVITITVHLTKIDKKIAIIQNDQRFE